MTNKKLRQVSLYVNQKGEWFKVLLAKDENRPFINTHSIKENNKDLLLFIITKERPPKKVN